MNNAAVAPILTSVMKGLLRPGRKYTFHDVGFLKLFWAQLDNPTKDLLREYVKQGKLEVVNSAISMNDVVLPQHFEVLQNFYNGRKWCLENIGNISKTSWYIDPFGFTDTHAELLTQMGFENLVITRIDYRDKIRRRQTNDLIFEWANHDCPNCNYSKSAPIDSNSTQTLLRDKLLTVIMPNHYNGSDFSVYLRKWVFEDPFVFGFNIVEKFQDLLIAFNRNKKMHSQNIFMDYYGDDFTHKDYEATVGSYEKLIAFTKYNPQRSEGFNVEFATPSQYFDDLRLFMSKTNLQIGEETPNFVPYIDFPFQFWVGFYSTRPKLKAEITGLLKTIRSVNNMLAGSFIQRQGVYDEAYRYQELQTEMNDIQNKIGILLHHDAITGTSNLRVIADYFIMIKAVQTRLTRLVKQCSAYNQFIMAETGSHVSTTLDPFLCSYVPLSICRLNPIRPKMSYLYILFNPLYRRSLTDTIKTTDESISLFDRTDRLMESYTHCLTTEWDTKDNRPTKFCKTVYHVELRPRKYKLVKLKARSDKEKKDSIFNSRTVIGCLRFNHKERFVIAINCTENPLELIITEIETGKSFNLTVVIKEYLTEYSGPYIFRPSAGYRQSPRHLKNNVLKSILITESPLLTEIRFVHFYTFVTVQFFHRRDDLQNQIKPRFFVDVEVMIQTKNMDVTKSDLTNFHGREFVVEYTSNFTQNSSFFRYPQNGLRSSSTFSPRFRTFVNDVVDDFGLGKCRFVSPSRKRVRHLLLHGVQCNER